jgi:hypothetical protein
MATAANVRSEEGSHWYHSDGKPCYELPKADGKGMKSPTLADARKLNLVPGVSSILKVLHKEALVVWRIEQAILAVFTTPRNDIIDTSTGAALRVETDDEFIHRVLSTERVQDQESQIARDRGTQMHDGLEMLSKNQPVAPDLLPWIQPAFDAVMAYGSPIATELHCIGRGYGGRIDLLQKGQDCLWIWDWKTTKKLPDPKKGAYLEHRLQASAYAMATEWDFFKKNYQKVMIKTGNVYISTVDQGQFVICEHPEWKDTFMRGFEPLVTFWQFSNGFIPQQ